MYLKQIELENFKSFGGKLTIPLMEGYLAVTGPNGSGKSNITDAILFVLGPKSSKAIRAGKLTDLIFDGGTSKSGKADYTKVSLVFDNEDRMIPLEEDIVKLTRHVKITQDGEGYTSYFYVNDRKSTLTEFDALLTRARISAEGYNLVQQGDVLRIVQMGNLERRRVLDSISGIASFDADLEKAGKERLEAEANVERVGIIITELNTQLEQLEKDMVAARKYLEAQKQMEMAKAQMVHRNLESVEAKISYTKEQIATHEKEVEELRAKKDKLSAEIEEYDRALEAKEREIEAKVGPEYRQLKDKIEGVKIEMATIRDRVERAEEDISEQETIISEYSESMRAVESELQESISALVRVDGELKDKTDQLTKVKGDHDKLRKDISSAGGEITVLQTKLQNLEEAIDKKSEEEKDAEVEVAKASTVAEEASLALSQLEEQVQQADFEINDAEWNLKETKGDSGGANDAKAMGDRIMAAKRKEAEFEKQESELNDVVNRLGLEYERLRTEKRVTENLSQGSQAVSAILAVRDKGAMKGIHGTVAELATVDPEYETALSVAAGGKMQSIVVDDDQVASDCINYLKREKLGRVTFVPLNKMVDGKPRARTQMIVDQTEGYAIDLIKFDKKYQLAFWYVLSDTVVMKTLEDARRVMGGVRIVTKAGELIEASGAMVGGTLSKQASMKFGPAAESQMDKVGSELRAATDALEMLKKQLREHREMIRALDGEFRNASTASIDVQGKLGKLEAQLSEVRDKKKRVAENLNGKKQQLADAQKALADAEKLLERISAELSKMRDEKSALRERITEMAPADIQERLQNTQDSQFDLETEVGRLTTEKATINAEKVGIEGQKEAINKQMDAAKKKIKEYQETISTADENINKIQVELDALKKIEAEMEGSITGLRDAKDDLLKKKYETENSKSTVMGKIDTKTDFALSQQAKILIDEETVKQLKEEIALIEIEVELPIPSEQELQRIIKSCEGVMAKVGNVNLRAIEDYDEKKERHTKLSEDVSSLNARITELAGLMDSLNSDKKKLFMETYDGVSGHFQNVYAELSGGGEAYMKLEFPDNPFEGGLIINAKPRNGKMLRLEALSGGEKSLTAMAFIFAIQEFQPSPLYMFDEVDMNLDSVNSELVAMRIKKSSSRAQFIQVSLRKVTLALAEHLIGVTRQPNGVSKVIMQPDLAEVSKYEDQAKKQEDPFAESKSDEAQIRDAPVEDAPDVNDEKPEKHFTDYKREGL